MGHGSETSIGSKGLDWWRCFVGHLLILGCTHCWYSRTNGRSFRILAYSAFALVSEQLQIILVFRVIEYHVMQNQFGTKKIDENRGDSKKNSFS